VPEWYKRNTYRPDGMVLWSAPNSLQKTFIQVLGSEAFQAALQGKAVVLDDERGHDEIPATFVTDLLQYDVAALLQRWQTGPLLIIHGAKDCIVTPEQAKMNLEIAGGYKQLHYMEGDNHHLDLRFKEAGNLIKEWLKENS
jgi:putative redox protein